MTCLECVTQQIGNFVQLKYFSSQLVMKIVALNSDYDIYFFQVMESEKRTWRLYARGLPRASSRHSLILGPSILMVSEERPLLPSVMFHFLLFRPKQVSYIIYGRLPFHITVKA